MKKVVIAGGTGFIGSSIAKRFRETGYEVLIISRNSNHISWKPIDMTEAFENAEIIINLAGKSINCRHTDANKKTITDSRLNTTLWIGNAILACKNPPKLWINSSACGIYRPSVNQPMNEDEEELGTDFLAEVVKKWEKVFFGFQLTETRKVALRTSVVLGKNGGALLPLVWLSRLWLGGKQGNGNQMVSWIHLEDYFQILLFLIENKSIQGVLNCTSPQPVDNNLFMKSIRKTLRIPIGLFSPKLMINLGARLIGTEPDLILNSSFVIPKRLQSAGFEFKYPDIDSAFNDLLK